MNDISRSSPLNFGNVNHFVVVVGVLGGNLLHDFRGATKDFVLSELERRKTELRTQLVWIGAQKEPGYTSRTWKWVNGNEMNKYI